ncbi:MAG: hypothetical protein M1817_004717 [Caeruleum heppii]|nr:MAG: hypothetical protein M1817_004717 [Caeruleum heppii]
MDLHYHSDPIRRTDPGFDILLSVDEIPDWPSDLERLELAYLRHWNGELASMFFRSLVESAQKLARLRCLAIKTSLQIEWRDRATFRESWIRRLEYVFLRTPPPPDSRLGSIRGWKQSEDGRFSDRPSAAAPKARTGPISPAARPVTGELAASSLVSSSPMHPGRRRSSRISRIANVVKGSKTRHEYRTSRDICSGNRLRSRPSAQPPLRSSRSKRACKSQDHVVESGSDMDDTSSDTSSGDGTVNDKSAYTNTSDVPEDDDRLYRQAMCDVVDIRIDNLRPMGVQYNEDDFLDAEASGDEDWDGKNEVSSRVQYAW